MSAWLCVLCLPDGPGASGTTGSGRGQVVCGKEHISFTTSKIGSLADVQVRVDRCPSRSGFNSFIASELVVRSSPVT